MIINKLEKKYKNPITVQELIDELNRVKDKNIVVEIGYEGIGARAYSCLEWHEGDTHVFSINE